MGTPAAGAKFNPGNEVQSLLLPDEKGAEHRPAVCTRTWGAGAQVAAMYLASSGMLFAAKAFPP